MKMSSESSAEHMASQARTNVKLHFLETVFNFFQSPTKQLVLQTETASHLPAIQRQMNKHPRYDVCVCVRACARMCVCALKGNAPSTGDKCSTTAINIVP